MSLPGQTSAERPHLASSRVSAAHAEWWPVGRVCEHWAPRRRPRSDMALSVWRPRNHMLRCWCAALVATLAVFLVAPGAGAQARKPPAEDVVQIGGLVAQKGGTWALLTSPPHSQAAKLFAPGAFIVSVDGSKVASHATPREPGDLGVAIIVSASVGGDFLKASQDAAIETVLGLPKTTRAAVIASGSKPKVIAPLGTDRHAATDAIGKVEQAPGSNALSAMSLAADTIKAAPRRAVIIFGPIGFVATPDIAAMGRTLAAHGVALFSVSANKAPKTLAQASLVTGGHTVASGTSKTTDRAVAAGQAIASQLGTQYLVTFTPKAKLTSHTKISVALDGVGGSEAKVSPLLLPGGDAALSTPAPHHRRHVPLALIAGAVLVVLLLIALLVVLRRRRRRARAEPVFQVTTTRVAVNQPTEPAQVEPGIAVSGRHRHPLGASPRAGQVDDALDRLDA